MIVDVKAILKKNVPIAPGPDQGPNLNQGIFFLVILLCNK